MSACRARAWLVSGARVHPMFVRGVRHLLVRRVPYVLAPRSPYALVSRVRSSVFSTLP